MWKIFFYFQDSLCEKIENFPKETKIRCLAKDGYFLENYIHQWNRCHPVSPKITIEYLQGIANLRLCMDRAAEVIFELHETSGKWIMVATWKCYLSRELP